MQSRLVFGVHGDSAHLAYVGKGQDVGDRLAIVPDFAQVGEITHQVRILVAAVRDGAKSTVATPDVGQETWVLEYRDRRLGVQQDPSWVDAAFVGLRKHISKLGQCGARGGCSRALGRVVSVTIASPMAGDARV